MSPDTDTDDARGGRGGGRRLDLSKGILLLFEIFNQEIKLLVK